MPRTSRAAPVAAVPCIVTPVVATSVFLAHYPATHVAVTPVFLAHSHAARVAVTPVFLTHSHFAPGFLGEFSRHASHCPDGRVSAAPAIMPVAAHFIRSSVNRSCRDGCNDQPADREDMPDFHISSIEILKSSFFPEYLCKQPDPVTHPLADAAGVEVDNSEAAERPAAGIDNREAWLPFAYMHCLYALS